MISSKVDLNIKRTKNCFYRIKSQISPFLKTHLLNIVTKVMDILHKKSDTPVPPGSVKFSHSARLADINVTVCDSDFDIVNIQLSGLEMDFLFRANERFVFRTFLSNINVDHLSDVTLYNKVRTRLHKHIQSYYQNISKRFETIGKIYFRCCIQTKTKFSTSNTYGMQHT